MAATEVQSSSFLSLVAVFLCAAILAGIPAPASATPVIVAQSPGALHSPDSTTVERAYSGAKYIGAARVRDIVENKSGFSWSTTDAFVENTRAHGLEPFLTLTYQPIENGGTLTPSVAGFSSFCSTAASRYGSKVRDYGIFNEPNSYKWHWSDGDHPVRAVDYGAMYRACYSASKAVNSGARIYIGELSNGASTVSPCSYLSNAVAAASTKAFGVGIHPYQVDAAPSTTLAGATCRGIGRIGDWITPLAQMTNLRTVSGTAVPLAITEYGYCASATNAPCNGGGAPTDEATRASWMMTSLQKADIAGAILFAQYHLVSTAPPGSWDTGIMGVDGTVREQMNAIRSFSQATWGTPGVVTGSLVQGGSGSVIVSGQVDPHGFKGTKYRFEYGTSSGFLPWITEWSDAGAGVAAATFNVFIGGLAPNTQYYYRIVAVGPAGASYGAVNSFITTP